MARRAPRPSHPTTRYAQSVVDGRIIAGPLVRDACLGHLFDLKEGHKRGLYFDEDEADSNFAFFEECLVHPEGKLEGQPFRLLPFQKFQHGNIYGWYGPQGRRFRIAYIEEGKGNGKSPRGSGNALYALIVDGGNASQIYCAAFSGRQAVDVGWTDCMNLAKASPKVDAQVEYNKHTHRIIHGSSFIGVLSSEDRGASGQRIKMGLVDELHEHRGPEVLQKIQKGTKSVKDPLIFIVTNSGVDRHSICFHYHEWAERVLKARIPGGDPAFADDQLFAFVCSLDPEDYQEKVKDEGEGTQRVQVSLAKIAEKPKLWLKANPGLGPVLDPQYLQKEVKQALNMPAAQNITLRLNFCVWTDSVSVWIPDDIWIARKVAAGRDLAEELVGETCIAGLDLGRTRDLSALMLLFPPTDHRSRWSFLEYYWCPEWDIRERSERDRIPYDIWAKEGYIIQTDGNVIDFARIKRDALDLAEKYHVEEWCYDRHFATQTVTELGQEGLTMVPVGQGAISMNAPICEIERLAWANPQKLEHCGHPVTRWMMGNVVLAGDKHGGYSIDKERSKDKVDGPQALADAMFRGVALYGEGNGKSIYDQRLEAGEPVWQPL